MTFHIRNFKYNQAGSIDLEYEHPKFGWIPFTAGPDDVEQHGRDIHAQVIADHSGEIAPYVAPVVVITAAQVDKERDRRIELGFSFGGVLYQSRPEDRENISGAATAALAAMMNGAQPGNYYWHGGADPFVWIASNNSTHQMDAQTMFDFGQAAMAHKQHYIFAGRSLKDMTPIPLDYATNDAYWRA